MSSVGYTVVTIFAASVSIVLKSKIIERTTLIAGVKLFLKKLLNPGSAGVQLFIFFELEKLFIGVNVKNGLCTMESGQKCIQNSYVSI